MNENRIQKWSEYRDSIYNNVDLHKEVISSNKRLSMLYNRLIKVFPEYNTLFNTKKDNKIKINKTQDIHQYEYNDIEDIINILNSNNKDFDLKYLDKINFSTEELDTILHDLKTWNPKGQYINSNNETHNIDIQRTKKIIL